MAECELVCVNPAYVDEVWPHVAHFAKQALVRGDLGTFDALERDVLSGEALLWLAWCSPVIEAIAVTQLVTTERSRACEIRACGGTRPHRWLGLLEQIEGYARAQHCTCTRIFGRRGWSRLLKNYRATKIILERRL